MERGNRGDVVEGRGGREMEREKEVGWRGREERKYFLFFESIF